ncbi:DUF2238 domain-containing protein [Candidatus Pacearchaeota archaeon]|nr:DUF2238 domain-containing protein [Candidatus Pacearchaeota archaeon]
MKIKKGEWGLILFNLIYVAIFTIYYLSIKNYEFLWYVAVLLFFVGLIAFTLKKSNFDYLILWGLSIWGFLHMAGGGVRVGDGVLYALQLIPIWVTDNFFILKFDQLVHFYGFAVATLVAHHLLKKYWNDDVNYKIVYPALVAIGMGLGALNEIVEFMAVVAFSNTGVGGYYNTALDLVFNTLGAIAAVIFIHVKKR